MTNSSNAFAKSFLNTLFARGVPAEVAYPELLKEASRRAQQGIQADDLTAPVLFEMGRKAAASLGLESAANS